MRPSVIGRRAVYVCASLAPAWAVIALVTDGIAVRLGPIRLSSTEPVRPLLFGGVAAAWYLWRYPRPQWNADANWLGASMRGMARLVPPVIALLGAIIGLVYGTFAAAGSDAYGYVSQAGLWLRGDLRVEQPIVAQMRWPDVAWTFTPLGYRPISADGTIVPTYPPGLPMLMAVFQAVFGADGPFFVVPALAAVALYATYVLGREAAGNPSVGALASLLLLASPVFLAHTMVPMTDVPVAAGWALVCALALRHTPRPLAAGVVAGATLLVRPNLVLLPAAPLCGWLFARGGSETRWRHAAVRRAAYFVAGLLPALLAVAAVNFAMYGSPLESGYGSLGEVYGIAPLGQNLRNYGIWLVQTQTPLVALAIVPFFTDAALRPSDGDSTPRASLGAVVLLTLLSYVFYAAFDNWTYLRFMLPAYPALAVLMAGGMRAVCTKVPLAARPAAIMLLVAACAVPSFQFAKDQFVFNWHEHESRYVRGARRAAELTPPNAVLFSSQHSGSLRYYTDRITLRYDLLPPAHLDDAIGQLRTKGRASFLVIDEWEANEFRRRFEAERAGRLDATPLARVPGQPDVLIYELTGRTE